MSEIIKVKKGLDIPLQGEAEKTISDFQSKTYAIKPPDFVGVFPKMLVQVGDKVKVGTAVFFDKYRDNIKFTSPVSGTVKDIRRGAKRVLLEVIIESDGAMDHEDFKAAKPADLDRDKIVEKMIQSGVWPMIRQRPYSIIANPDDDPKAIFISAFDSSPLAPDFDLIVHGQGDTFQAGLDVLVKLTSGKVHLNVRSGAGTSKVFSNSKGVQLNQFSGPHPAGNVGTQIASLDPINKGDIVWYLRPQEVLSIGRLFMSGKFDSERIVALTGSEVTNRHYIKTQIGACLEKAFNGNIDGSNVRYISGNVLTGQAIPKDGYLGFYDNQVTVIPEGDYFEFMGWALFRLQKFSMSKSYLSFLFPNKKYRLDTNLNGGERAFVVTGQYEQVFPGDVMPMQLLKSILIEDIDQMEKLGIYEVDEEDFALCEYVDTSKTPMQEIVRHGLNLMRKEMM